MYVSLEPSLCRRHPCAQHFFKILRPLPLSLSLPPLHSRTHTLALSLSLTHALTHTRTHTLARTHTRPQPLPLQACYTLMRLCRLLKDHMLPFVGAILGGIQVLLAVCGIHSHGFRF